MKILVAYDGSPWADAAIDDLRHAGFSNESEVLIVSVANPGLSAPKHADVDEGQLTNAWKADLKEAEVFAERTRDRVQARFPEWKVSGEPLWGEPAKTILKTIDDWKPDLLVVGSHGRTAAGRLMMGSVSLELVRHAPCSVRVTRVSQGTPTDPARILVAIDGSAQAEAAVQEVAHRRWPKDTHLRVISILDPAIPTVVEFMPFLEGRAFATEPGLQVTEAADERERARLRGVVDASAERLRHAGLSVSADVIQGNPRSQILEVAEHWRAGTVFVGARGVGALDRFLLGSISNAVVTHAHCTVEVIRLSDC